MDRWIPYGRQCVTDDDIQAVAEVLKSDWLTTGPEVEKFEAALADYCGSRYAVVMNSGTAALHAAYHAAGVQPGDEVITSPLTFAATANAALYLGAKVVFGDIQPDTGNLDPTEVERLINGNTRVVTPVAFAGHPADMDEIIEIAHRHGALVVEDACHALGAKYRGLATGTVADMTVFSFHPVKHITTGEGGAVLTDSAAYAERLRAFRSHGIVRDSSKQSAKGPWYYEMQFVGYNYRLPDILCALGSSQLTKLPEFLKRRHVIACAYSEALTGTSMIELPSTRDYVEPAWHLYVIRVENSRERLRLVQHLRSAGIMAQVHYIPVYVHRFYQENPQRWKGYCPEAESFYERCISLPIFPSLADRDVEFVVETLLRGLE